jgi:hypothetical protein
MTRPALEKATIEFLRNGGRPAKPVTPDPVQPDDAVDPTTLSSAHKAPTAAEPPARGAALELSDADYEAALKAKFPGYQPPRG